MKMLSYNKNEIEYSWHGIVVTGRRYHEDMFMFSFPKRKIKSPIKLKNGNFTYILDGYDVDIEGHRVGSSFVHDEVEDTIIEQMKFSSNKQLLIDMVFNDTISIGE